MVENIQSMLVKLQSRPDDVDLRRDAAELLYAQGSLDDAVAVLAPLRNIAGHDPDSGLPCLCKRCLPSAGHTATAHTPTVGDLVFVRTFAVVDSRVLHFWMLVQQDHTAVRASVADALRARLAYQPERD